MRMKKKIARQGAGKKIHPSPGDNFISIFRKKIHSRTGEEKNNPPPLNGEKKNPPS